MGYNTGILILNDGMHLLKDDPNAGKRLYDGILQAHNQSVTVGLKGFANPIMVLPSQHADVTQIIAIGQNYARTVHNHYGYLSGKDNSPDLKFAVLQKLADELGFSLRRKPTRRVID